MVRIDYKNNRQWCSPGGEGDTFVIFVYTVRFVVEPESRIGH